LVDLEGSRAGYGAPTAVTTHEGTVTRSQDEGILVFEGVLALVQLPTFILEYRACLSLITSIARANPNVLVAFLWHSKHRFAHPTIAEKVQVFHVCVVLPNETDPKAIRQAICFHTLLGVVDGMDRSWIPTFEIYITLEIILTVFTLELEWQAISRVGPF
jgi:hypothetical protein